MECGGCTENPTVAANSQRTGLPGHIPYPKCDRECYRTDEVGLAKGARAWVRAAESLIVRSSRGLYVQGAWWLGAWQARYEEMSPTNRANVEAYGHMSVTSRFYGGSPIRNGMGGRVRGREEQEGGGGKGGRKVKDIMHHGLPSG